MNYKFELLSNENAYEYAYVNSTAWLETYPGLIDQEFLESLVTEEALKEFEEKLKGYIINDPNIFYLLRVDNKPVGIVHVRKTKFVGYEEYGELGAIYLLNEFKRKGYGKILFEKAKEELKKMGYTKMINGCINGNPSNEFYKHMGGKYIMSVPFIVKKTGQILRENVYIYDSI